MPRCLPPLSIRMYPTEVPREPHGDRMSSWIRMRLNHGFRRVPRRRVCRRLTSGMQDGFVDVYSSGSGAAEGLEPGPRKAVRSGVDAPATASQAPSWSLRAVPRTRAPHVMLCVYVARTCTGLCIRGAVSPRMPSAAPGGRCPGWSGPSDATTAGRSQGFPANVDRIIYDAPV